MATDRGLVAITGANGTIGYHVVLHALRTHYRVRCVLRREEAITQIRLGPSFKQYNDRVSFYTVPDNTKPDAYDEALHGVKYVVHIAGVWPKPNYHPDDEVYIPYVKSMENILSAARKSGSVKRIVFTQAGAGLINPGDGSALGTTMEQVLDENVGVNAQSAAFRVPLASPHHAYCGAKAYCMAYLKELKDKEDLFSIVQIIPGTVIGPSELVTTVGDARKYMDRMSAALLFSVQPRPRYAFGFVSVDDCAKVHIEALDEAKVPNGHIPDWFVAAATTPQGKDFQQIWNEVADAIERDFPGDIEKSVFELGRNNWPINVPFRVDSTLTEQTLLGGKQFQSLIDSVRNVASWYTELARKE